jgi:hypothetical protein
VSSLFFGGDVALVAIIDFFWWRLFAILLEKKVPSNSVKGTFGKNSKKFTTF